MTASDNAARRAQSQGTGPLASSPGSPWVFLLFFSFFLFIFGLFVFLGLHPQHMEVPRLGVQSEL